MCPRMPVLGTQLPKGAGLGAGAKGRRCGRVSLVPVALHTVWPALMLIRAARGLLFSVILTFF